MAKPAAVKTRARRGPQARGIERRKELIDAADQLLEVRDIDGISLADIAEKAGFPVGSAYSLFPTVSSVMAGLLIRHTDQLIDQVEAAISAADAETWMEIVDQFIDGMAKYYRASRPARQLRLSGKALPEVRYAQDRQTGEIVARRLRRIIEQAFALPQIPEDNRPLVVMLDIADAVLVSEFIRTKSLPPGIAREAKRASAAYLKLYIPEFLPRRAPTPESKDTP